MTTLDDSNDAHEAAIDITEETQAASAAFFEAMQRRHLMGEEQYGPIKFLEVNTLLEAMDEVVDLANYAMYTFMKLWVLNKQIQHQLGEQPEVLGAKSFMKG
jgi:hypothetical protein